VQLSLGLSIQLWRILDRVVVAPPLQGRLIWTENKKIEQETFRGSRAQRELSHEFTVQPTTVRSTCDINGVPRQAQVAQESKSHGFCR
jgi:hypothetical protein